MALFINKLMNNSLIKYEMIKKIDEMRAKIYIL